MQDDIKRLMRYLESNNFNCECNLECNEVCVKKYIFSFVYARINILFRTIYDEKETEEIVEHIRNLNESKSIYIVVCYSDLQFTKDFCTYVLENGGGFLHFVYINRAANEITYDDNIYYHKSKYVRMITRAIMGNKYKISSVNQ